MMGNWSLGHVRIGPLDAPLFSGTLRPEWSFAGIEILVVIFAVLCLRDAIRSGRAGEGILGVSRPNASQAAAFFATILFTLILESALSSNKEVYTYPNNAFFIQVANVPLWVPIGWAFILYVVIGTTTKLGVPMYVAALLDGFLALNLDLTLDPIAIHRGWWTWNVHLNPQEFPHFADYFGIPVINFMGWFVIIGAFSLFVRLGRAKVPPGTRGIAGDVVPPFLAIVPAFVVVLAYQVLGIRLMKSPSVLLNGGFLASLVWMVCAALVISRARSFRHDAPFKKLFVAAPIAFHAYMFVLLFVTKAKDIAPAIGGEYLFVTLAELTIFFPVVAALGLCLYFWPYMDDLATPGPLPVNPHAAGEVGKARV
jgi:hypothetical protein